MTATLLPFVSHGLPEHGRYLDEGCDLAPACLRCPFVRCRFDEPRAGGVRQLRVESRRLAAQELRERGWSAAQIARAMRLSRRSAFRLLADAAPSILMPFKGRTGSWHGYLERGVWREC